MSVLNMGFDLVWPRDLNDLKIDESQKNKVESFLLTHSGIWESKATSDEQSKLLAATRTLYQREVNVHQLLFATKQIGSKFFVSDVLLRLRIPVGKGTYRTAYKIYNLTTGCMCVEKAVQIKEVELLNHFRQAVHIEGIYRVFQLFADERISVDQLYLTTLDKYSFDDYTIKLSKVEMIKNLISGLTYLHGLTFTEQTRDFPVFHGDIKPANIFLSHEEAVLGDFNHSNRCDSISGSPLYQSPDRMAYTVDYTRNFNDEPCRFDLPSFVQQSSQPGDVWALGLIIAYILRGDPEAVAIFPFIQDCSIESEVVDCSQQREYFFTLCSRVEQVRINADIDELMQELTDTREREICDKVVRPMLEKNSKLRWKSSKVKDKLATLLTKL